jgi:hypothetical protein
MISQIIIGNITISGDSISTGYVLGNTSGFEMPELRIDVKDKGNYHGARLGSKLYGRRIFTVNFTILGSSASDYETKRQNLINALGIMGGTYTMRINTRDGTQLKSEAIINSLDVPYSKGNVVMGDVRVELVAPNPFIKSYLSVSGTVYQWSGGGFAIPFGIPLDMSTQSDALKTITNNGNGNAYPVITIHGQIENPTVYNVTTGEDFSLTYNIGNGDYITIDTWNRTVVLNGTTNVKRYFSGDWLYLPSGDSEIKMDSASSDDDARAVFVYNHAYLGI